MHGGFELSLRTFSSPVSYIDHLIVAFCSRSMYSQTSSLENLMLIYTKLPLMLYPTTSRQVTPYVSVFLAWFSFLMSTFKDASARLALAHGHSTFTVGFPLSHTSICLTKSFLQIGSQIIYLLSMSCFCSRSLTHLSCPLDVSISLSNPVGSFVKIFFVMSWLIQTSCRGRQEPSILILHCFHLSMLTYEIAYPCLCEEL